MPYNELINDYEFVRDYLREFYIYGYRTKEETVSKQSRKHTQENKGTSNRSYEDKKRQIRSWLLGYTEDKKYVDGYVPYISIDSREIVHNPLYRTFKTGRFLKNDILTYFCLMDCMTAEWLSVSEITSLLSGYNLNNVKWSEKKVREKLRHYVNFGILKTDQGKAHGKKGEVYALAENKMELSSWMDAISFFSEVNQLGVIGSSLLDKKEFRKKESVFYFKHHYLLHALDSEVVLTLLQGIRKKCYLEITVWSRRQQKNILEVFPVKIYVSTQNGRVYLACFKRNKDSLLFLRVDTMQNVVVKDSCEEDVYEAFEKNYENRKQYLWGVETGDTKKVSHVEMTVFVGQDEGYMLQRLEREKRNGHIEQVSETQYKYVVDTYNAMELLPWIRTFTGRITNLESSNPLLKEKFEEDMKQMYAMYIGGDNYAGE